MADAIADGISHSDPDRFGHDGNDRRAKCSDRTGCDHYIHEDLRGRRCDGTPRHAIGAHPPTAKRFVGGGVANG